jgi:hypothetical protein
VLHARKFVRPQIQILKLWQLWELVLDLINLVAAQVQLSQRGQLGVACQRCDLVVLQVKLLELGHIFEWGKSLELVVHSFQNLQICMALPTIVDLLQLVVRDIEVLELRHLKGCEISKLIATEIKVLELQEVIFTGENGNILDLILGYVEMDQIVQLLERSRVSNIIDAQVHDVNFLGLLNSLVNLLNIAV